MSLKNLAKATSIRQRYDSLKNYYLNNHLTYSNNELENYKKWRSRPTTVTDERFKEILASMRLTEEEFDLAIKELTSVEKEYITMSISEDSWVKTTKQILAQEDRLVTDIFDDEKANFTYALRLHIDYLETKLDQIIAEFPTIQVEKTALDDYIGEVINRFMDIGLRTFVYDLHVEKDKLTFTEMINEKEGFRQYLRERFDNQKN